MLFIQHASKQALCLSLTPHVQSRKTKKYHDVEVEVDVEAGMYCRCARCGAYSVSGFFSLYIYVFIYFPVILHPVTTYILLLYPRLETVGQSANRVLINRPINRWCERRWMLRRVLQHAGDVSRMQRSLSSSPCCNRMVRSTQRRLRQ